MLKLLKKNYLKVIILSLTNDNCKNINEFIYNKKEGTKKLCFIFHENTKILCFDPNNNKEFYKKVKDIIPNKDYLKIQGEDSKFKLVSNNKISYYKNKNLSNKYKFYKNKINNFYN